ncbi:MAG: PQQ-dependent sugar dehydrogenase [Rhodobacter sp.]|nr:PQQ-dependent sugar dehydrogenase [Rhodobacter sp.]
MPVVRIVLAAMFSMLPVAASHALDLQLIAENLTAPIGIADPDDGTGRLFVLEQQGVVQVLDGNGALAAPLLDLRAHLKPLEEGFEERGLLGFALHPDFNRNGLVYVSYSAPLRSAAPSGWNYTRRISELTLAPGADTIDPGSERVLIELDWPSRKHNGGGLSFGPDGYLYIGLGDAGGAHGVGPQVIWSAFEVPADQLYWDRLAQDVTSLYGSILRIDIDKGFPGYGIPPTNPFVGKPGRDEIYAWGFRNPYRLGIDAQTGAILVTAIAETLWEAAYLVRGPGNFGWPLREATHCIDRTRPRDPPKDCARVGPNGYRIEDPVVEYPNMQVMDPATKVDATGVGTAIVGARIYRGAAIPELSGKLVFADWSADFRTPSGQLFVATPSPDWGHLWPFEQLRLLDTRIVSLDTDADGELYVLTNDMLGPFGTTGKVFKLIP